MLRNIISIILMQTSIGVIVSSLGLIIPNVTPFEMILSIIGLEVTESIMGIELSKIWRRIRRK